MSRATAGTHAGVPQAIRRLASSPTTRRYAATLPEYQTIAELPKYMADMLKRLEDLENKR
jgi:hypothetical protein